MSKRQKTDKRIIALFDVDGTLTVPRKVREGEGEREPQNEQRTYVFFFFKDEERFVLAFAPTTRPAADRASLLYL